MPQIRLLGVLRRLHPCSYGFSDNGYQTNRGSDRPHLRANIGEEVLRRVLDKHNPQGKSLPPHRVGNNSDALRCPSNIRRLLGSRLDFDRACTSQRSAQRVEADSYRFRKTLLRRTLLCCCKPAQDTNPQRAYTTSLHCFGFEASRSTGRLGNNP